VNNNNEKEKNFVSAVIYAGDDAERAVKFIGKVNELLTLHFENFEIIVVDDYCKTPIQDELLECSDGYNCSVSLIKMSYPQGVQRSMNAGVDAAIGDFVFEFESTAIDYNIELIIEVYRKSISGFDVVSAVPVGNTKKSSKFFYSIFNKYSDGYNPLFTERFRVVSRRAINRIESMTTNLVYRKVLYRNSGLMCSSVEYMPIAKINSKSLPKERSKLAFDSLMTFTSVGYRISLSLSIFMMLFTAFSGIYAVVVFLLGKPVEGWTTLMILISSAFSGIFLLLTIIIKYLSLQVEITTRKSKYIYENLYKIK